MRLIRRSTDDVRVATISGICTGMPWRFLNPADAYAEHFKAVAGRDQRRQTLRRLGFRFSAIGLEGALGGRPKRLPPGS